MRNKKGFTLIELLIVIAIIGILSAALLPTVLNAPARGRDSARLGNMNSIVAALEAYNSDFGKYPTGAGCVGDETKEEVFVNVDGDSVTDNYFSGGIAPQDPSKSREVDADPGNCVDAGLYYYKYVGEVGVAEYIIGTVMEIETNNNSDINPEDIDDSSTGILTCTTEPCDFYVLIK